MSIDPIKYVANEVAFQPTETTPETKKIHTNIKEIFEHALKLSYAEGQITEIHHTIKACTILKSITAAGLLLTNLSLIANGVNQYWNWYHSPEGKFAPLFGFLGGPSVIPDIPPNYATACVGISGILTAAVSNSFCNFFIKEAEMRKFKLIEEKVLQK